MSAHLFSLEDWAIGHFSGRVMTHPSEVQQSHTFKVTLIEKSSTGWNLNHLNCCGDREYRCFQSILRKPLFFPRLWIPGNSPKPLKRKSDYWADSSPETDHNDSVLVMEWNDKSVMAYHSQEKNFETMWFHMHTLDRFISEPWKVSLPLTGQCRMTGSLPLSKKNFNASFKARPVVDSNGDSKCYLRHGDLIRHSRRALTMHNSKLGERQHLNTFRKLPGGKSGKQPVQQPVGTLRLGYRNTTRVSKLLQLCDRVYQKNWIKRKTFESSLTFLSNMLSKIRLRINKMFFLIWLKSKRSSGLALTAEKSQKEKEKEWKWKKKAPRSGSQCSSLKSHLHNRRRLSARWAAKPPQSEEQLLSSSTCWAFISPNFQGGPDAACDVTLGA